MPVDPPIRANGGVHGFGIDLHASIKTSMTADSRIRVTSDDVPTVSKVQVVISGNVVQEFAVGGEWEILFFP